MLSDAAAVEAESVSKHFRTDAGSVRPVHEVSLEVESGSSLAITGPSGCGKSTLLSIIGGLEAPSSGRVKIGEQAISDLDEEERARLRRERIGWVFQSHNLQPFLTAVENVSLALALDSRTEGYDRSLGLLDSLGLGAAADRFPDQLSGGERQRVAVARALVHQPSLILADEPTGSLDQQSSSAVIEILLAARAEVGATLIVITHDPVVADRLDRTLELRDGEVVDVRDDVKPRRARLHA